jgi:hypothetical protein
MPPVTLLELPVPASRELRQILYDGRYDELHQDLCKLFHDEVFRSTDGLTTAQQCRVAYNRLRLTFLLRTETLGEPGREPDLPDAMKERGLRSS